LRTEGPGRDARAREALERSIAIAPDWVAPRRLLDEILRGELRGVEALQAHLEALEKDPRNAGELYLAGRLEGLDGIERFEHAADADPSLAWAHHGLGWAANVRGDAKRAVEHARLALKCARDSWERSFFTATLARFLGVARDREQARELIEERVREPDTSSADRTALAVLSVSIGLEDDSSRVRTESYERGLELVRVGDLAEAEVEELTARLRATGSYEDPDSQRLSLALGSEQSAARDRLRAELMLESGATPLALGLFERALGVEGRALPGGALVRAARFAAGDFARGVERWRNELPSVVLDEHGIPKDVRLARIVSASRALAGDGADPRAA
jgi:tetratricopeptide (TPR) repeat protein